jgi:hypothetical protein
LIKNYRSDFVFRSLIAQKIFLSRHSLSKSVLINELRIGTTKADMVILNGSSTAYEIKSDIDNFARLSNQLTQYIKVFDYVFVVVSHKRLHNVLDSVSNNVGIMVLSESNKIRTQRKAISNKRNVIPSVIFDTLRKDEYSKIITQEFGAAPNVPNTRFFTECKKMFCTLPPERAHDIFVQSLKHRVNYSSKLKSFIKVYPDFLQYPVLRGCFTDNQIDGLNSRLFNDWGNHVLSIPQG